jgi:hypothetical protein
MRKCLKVEYLGRIEYGFQKSHVTGLWDHKDSVSAKKVLKKFHDCVPLKHLNVLGKYAKNILSHIENTQIDKQCRHTCKTEPISANVRPKPKKNSDPKSPFYT